MCGSNVQNISSVVEVNKYIYTRGCIEATSEFIERHMNFVAGACLGSAFIQLLAIFLARSLQSQIMAQRARWMWSSLPLLLLLQLATFTRISMFIIIISFSYFFLNLAQRRHYLHRLMPPSQYFLPLDKSTHLHLESFLSIVWSLFSTNSHALLLLLLLLWLAFWLPFCLLHILVTSLSLPLFIHLPCLPLSMTHKFQSTRFVSADTRFDQYSSLRRAASLLLHHTREKTLWKLLHCQDSSEAESPPS